MFGLNTNFDADSLLYSLSHCECDGHTAHMLTQWCLPPPLVPTSTVKLSLFTHAHSSPLSLAARLHQHHTNHSPYISHGWTFSRQTSCVCVCVYVHLFVYIATPDLFAVMPMKPKWWPMSPGLRSILGLGCLESFARCPSPPCCHVQYLQDLVDVWVLLTVPLPTLMKVSYRVGVKKKRLRDSGVGRGLQEAWHSRLSEP